MRQISREYNSQQKILMEESSSDVPEQSHTVIDASLEDHDVTVSVELSKENPLMLVQDESVDG